MATVYLLQMCCGDYYCDEQHPAGAYSTRDAAEAALHAARAVEHKDFNFAHTPFATHGGTIIELDLDAPPQYR